MLAPASAANQPSMATIRMAEGIINGKDNRVGVFINLKKAFDSIDHNISVNISMEYEDQH